MNEEIEQIEEKYYNNLLILLNHKKVDITAYNILKKYDIKTILHNDKYIKKLRNDFIKSKYKDLDNKEFINIIEKNYYNQINKGQFMENLKYYSDLKGITPSKMAKKLDIPLSTVFDWYNGVHFPKVCHLYFLIRELNITYQDLLTDNLNKGKVLDVIPMGNELDNNYHYEEIKSENEIEILQGLKAYYDNDCLLDLEELEENEKVNTAIDVVIELYKTYRDNYYKVCAELRKEKSNNLDKVSIKDVELSNFIHSNYIRKDWLELELKQLKEALPTVKSDGDTIICVILAKIDMLEKLLEK